MPCFRALQAKTTFRHLYLQLSKPELLVFPLPSTLLPLLYRTQSSKLKTRLILTPPFSPLDLNLPLHCSPKTIVLAPIISSKQLLPLTSPHLSSNPLKSILQLTASMKYPKHKSYHGISLLKPHQSLHRESQLQAP